MNLFLIIDENNKPRLHITEKTLFDVVSDYSQAGDPDDDNDSCPQVCLRIDLPEGVDPNHISVMDFSECTGDLEISDGDGEEVERMWN